MVSESEDQRIARSRVARTLGEIRWRASWISLKWLRPARISRRISGVQRSAKISAARATGHI